MQCHKQREIYAPTSVDLNSQKVVWATKYVQRNRSTSECHAYYVMRVQGFPCIPDDISDYLRDPKRVHNEKNRKKEIVQLIHEENAPQKKAICRAGDFG